MMIGNESKLNSNLTRISGVLMEKYKKVKQLIKNK